MFSTLRPAGTFLLQMWPLDGLEFEIHVLHWDSNPVYKVTKFIFILFWRSKHLLFQTKWYVQMPEGPYRGNYLHCHPDLDLPVWRCARQRSCLRRRHCSTRNYAGKCPYCCSNFSGKCVSIFAGSRSAEFRCDSGQRGWSGHDQDEASISLWPDGRSWKNRLQLHRTVDAYLTSRMNGCSTESEIKEVSDFFNC